MSPPRGWKRPFTDPIPLPRRRQLVTLEDAGNYITRLSKGAHEAQEWQALERIRQVRRHSPKVGAVCGNSARTDLGGGRSVMTVPTALRSEYFAF